MADAQQQLSWRQELPYSTQPSLASLRDSSCSRSCQHSSMGHAGPAAGAVAAPGGKGLVLKAVIQAYSCVGVWMSISCAVILFNKVCAMCWRLLALGCFACNNSSRSRGF